MVRPATLMALILAAGLSGCTVGPNENVPASEGTITAPGQFSETTGALVGTVTNEELMPLPGVVVSLNQAGLVATTSEDGRFSFSHLSPGKYALNALLEGHAALGRDVEVVAGEQAVVALVMSAGPTTEPHTIVLPQKVNIPCAIFLNFSFETRYTCEGIPGTDRPLVKFQMANWTGLTEIVGETVWRASQYSSTHAQVNWQVFFNHTTSKGQLVGGTINGFRPGGSSPIRGAVTWAVLADRAREEGMQGIGSPEVAPYNIRHVQATHGAYAPALSASVLIDQTLESFLTSFFWGPAPEGYSSLPDS